MKTKAIETRAQALEKSLRRDARSNFFIAAIAIAIVCGIVFGIIYLWIQRPDSLFVPERGDVLQTATVTIRSVEVSPASAETKRPPEVVVRLPLFGKEILVHQPQVTGLPFRAGQRVRVTYRLSGSLVIVTKVEPFNKAQPDF